MMQYKHVLITLYAVLAAAISPSVAHAQWENTFQVPVWNPGLDLLADSIRPPSNDDAGDDEQEAPKTPLENLQFHRNTLQARQNMMNFATDLRAKDPATLDSLEFVFVNSDLEDIFVKVDLDMQAFKAMNPVGLRSDSLIDAYAFWWVKMWEAAYGDADVTSRPGMYGMVKRQVSDVFLKMPKLQTATNEEKQKFADGLMIKALLLQDYMNRLEDSPTELANFGKAVEQNAKRSGIDLSAVMLTQNGFVQR